jgi:hypothetical protein
MAPRKLTKPTAIAAAAAIAVGGATYTTSALSLAPAAAASQIETASNRRAPLDNRPAPVDKAARVRRSAAAVGLARDLGISRAAAQELLHSTYS